jgi:hypothetical protein
MPVGKRILRAWDCIVDTVQTLSRSKFPVYLPYLPESSPSFRRFWAEYPLRQNFYTFRINSLAYDLPSSNRIV